MKIKRDNKALSEIIGTILLLAIAVSLFSTVYVFVINQSLDPSDHPPAVHIVGTTEAKSVHLENRGQEPLSPDTIIMLTIAGQQINTTIGAYLDDTNGDGFWNVGEKIVFNSSALGVDIIGLQVEAVVIDAVSGSVVMMGTLQEGDIFEFPYVLTQNADNIESDRAKLWMDYNFRNYSGDLRFAYKNATGNWSYTTWLVGQSGGGSYGLTVSGLIPETVYFFKAQLKYDSNTLEDIVRSFSTLGIVVGMWHFDTGSGTIAYDSSGRDNHGNLYYGPQWTTGINGTTSLRYDGIDDYVEVPDNPSLDISDEITMEAWMKPLEHSEGYYGDITSSILDSASFGIFNIYDPDIIHVLGDIYAIACRGDGNDGFLVTVEIFNDGQINPVVIDTFEFYTSDCYEPDIIHVDGTIYAIAFRRPNLAYIATVEIYNDGKINHATIDTLQFATTYREPHIFHINGTVYTVAYTGLGYDGYLTSIDIAINGQINGVIDTLIFDNALAGVVEEFNVIHVFGDVYAIAYRNADSDGEIRTVNITSGGQITSPTYFDGDYIGKFPFDIFDGWEPNIININANVYAIAYGGFNEDGMLRTITINNDGSIVQNTIDAFEFDINLGREPDIIHITGDIYAVAYRGPDYDGWLVTVDIANDGTIAGGVVDSYEFDISTCYDPNIIHINGNIYAIAYRGLYDDGLLKTVQIASNGTISQPAIDQSEFGVFDCYYPDILKISDTIYATVFRGLEDDGYLRTFEIASDGQINNTIIDSFRFHTGYVLDPMLIHINANVYAIVYSNLQGSWHGFLKTVSFDSGGNITGVIDSLDFETTQGIRPDIVHVNGDVYAIAYRGPSSHGYVKSVNIFNDGNIASIGMAAATQKFVANTCYYPDISHVSGDVYAIAYTGSGWDGYLNTVKIANDGAITVTGMDILEFDTSYCVYSNIINITGDICAIAYTGSGTDGYLKTVEIDSNGMILGGVIDSLEFDTSYCYRPDVIHIKGRTYAVSYTGPGSDGYVRTFRIGENGDIVNSIDSNFEFDSSNSYECRIVHVNGSVFAIAYRNSYADGLLRTVEIQYTPRVGYIIARDNSYEISANSTTIFAYLNGVYLTAPISSGFNYVVLTYDKNAGSNQMKLYVNTTLVNWTTYSTPINTNNNDLYFGRLSSNGLNSIIDEITLWRSPLTQAEINQHYTDLTS